MRPAAMTHRPSRLGLVGRYVVVVLLTMGAWVISLPDDPNTASQAVQALVLLDIVLGVAAIPVLVLRRRAPVLLAVVLSLLLLVSSACTGAWILSAVSLGTRRRVLPSVVVVVLAAVCSVTYEQLSPVAIAAATEASSWWSLLGFAVILYSFVLAIGFYIGARRDLVESLRLRAETAEKAQATRAAQARVAERSRIAREMHDVLAHRISTVAMHSGALAYRDDLTPEQVRAAAGLIQENAHTALTELRDILGVLREDTPETDGERAERSERTPEPPQPTIADIPGLVQEAVTAGQQVDLDLDLAGDHVPDTVGRHVYRAVQECLTNARKHAPGAPVDVRIHAEGHRRSRVLVLSVGNPLAATTPRPDDHGTIGASHLPGLFPALRNSDRTTMEAPASGLGLLGLTERAELAGGELHHGAAEGRYVTRLAIPLPRGETS